MSTTDLMPQIKIKSTYKKEKLINLNGIAGKVKKFDPKLHSKYDLKARDILKNRFPENVQDNPNIYGEDLLFTHDKIPFKFIEVQVCSSWDDKFPYPFPFVYARKMKFSDDTLFVTFNRTYTKVHVFAKSVIDIKPSRLKKYAREMVHYVSWYRTFQLETCDLTLENIMSYAGIK